MKSLSKLTLALILSLTAATSFSQASSKPTLFDKFPNSINCSAFEFNNALATAEGEHVILFFANNFKFSGTVISNVIKYSTLQTMTIKSDHLANTIFHLSKQLLDDNSVSFVGRILSPNASDAYEIKKDLSGNYRFEKIEAGKIMQDCSLVIDQK